MQSHLQGEEALEQDTLSEGADGVSEERPDGQPSETVHPDDGQSAGDETVFHEEGGRKFATKEDFIKFYRQQRGAASALARDKKRLEQDLQLAQERLNAIEGRKGADKASAESQAEEDVDEQYRAAVERVKKVGKFATSEEISDIKRQLEELSAERAAVRQDTVRKQVETFLSSNPDALEYRAELADLVNDHNLTLHQAYTLFFGKPPKDAAPKATPVRDAYQKGKANAIRQSQAGGPVSARSGQQAGEGGQFFDWGLL